jgi:hypothetical protein
MTQEEIRLQEARTGKTNWKMWGSHLKIGFDRGCLSRLCAFVYHGPAGPSEHLPR